jgi:hypothetical protein
MTVLVGCTNTATPDLGMGNLFAAQIPFVIPPRNAEASKIHQLSIVPLANQTSQSIARSVEGAMIGLKFAEKPYYTKVALDEANAATLLTPQALQGVVTRDQTQGVLTVLFTGQRLDRRSYQESRSECTAKSSGFSFKCPAGATRTFQVQCEEKTAYATADVRVYDASSKRTVYSDTLAEKAGGSACSDQATVVDADLIGQAIGALSMRIVSAVAPTTQLRPLDLMEPDALVTGAATATFQEGLRFARAKRLDEACNRFGDLYDNNKESTNLTYNVAFCDEARGDLVNAVSRYRRASELAHGPNSQIDKHLNAVEKQIKEVGLVAVSRTGDTATPGGGGVVLTGGRRVALVVGNARYKRGALINPINDARLMETQLRKVGFDVVKVENVDSARFETVVADFINKSRGARVALFYYAGHAIQSDGANLLMPVDNESMRTMDEVREKSISVTSVLAQLEVAAPDVKLVVLDSCRDSPLPSVTRSLTGGLAPIATPPSGALIAFATSPGQTAIDGDGKNSVFTKYLARELDKPGATLEDVFKQVRVEVQRETKNRQKPTEVSSLTGTFYFRPPN